MEIIELQAGWQFIASDGERYLKIVPVLIDNRKYTHVNIKSGILQQMDNGLEVETIYIKHRTY